VEKRVHQKAGQEIGLGLPEGLQMELATQTENSQGSEQEGTREMK